jgi:hypothetical protein
MKVTYDDLNKSGMMETLAHVYNRAEFSSIGASYRVLKIKRALEETANKAREEFKALLKEHVVHVNDQPEPSEDGAFKLANDTPEGRKAFEEATEKFHAVEADLGDLKQITLQDLERGVKLTPRQLDSILPFISGVDALDK